MKKELETLISMLEKFEGFKLIFIHEENEWIHFLISEENSQLISNVINDISDQYMCNFLLLTSEDFPNQTTYQLVFDEENKKKSCLLIAKKLSILLEKKGDIKNATNHELGLPDLSLLTIRQMATELKSRQNLTFALVWIENSERENIAIEGSGNPTHLIGLLARAQNMAIDWADKNIKFYRPNRDE